MLVVMMFFIQMLKKMDVVFVMVMAQHVRLSSQYSTKLQAVVSRATFTQLGKGFFEFSSRTTRKKKPLPDRVCFSVEHTRADAI